MKKNKGYILVVVLLIMAIISAVLINFIRVTYLFANTAANFKESERMALVIKSTYRFAVEQTREYLRIVEHTYQNAIPIEQDVDDMKMVLTVYDNQSRLNINLLKKDNRTYWILKRLLKDLALDEAYADRLVDWIDRDSISETAMGETDAKNYKLFSLSELSYIFSRDDMNKILPYITVFGERELGVAGSGIYEYTININTAGVTLLKALHKNMTGTLAEQIVTKRQENPFKDINEVANFISTNGSPAMWADMREMITVKSSSFNVIIRGQKGDMVSEAEAYFTMIPGRTTLYWKEF